MYAKILTEDNSNFASLYFLSLHPYVSCLTLLNQENAPIYLYTFWKVQMSLGQKVGKWGQS